MKGEPAFRARACSVTSFRMPRSGSPEFITTMFVVLLRSQLQPVVSLLLRRMDSGPGATRCPGMTEPAATPAGSIH